jgi:hypothetical protein
LNIIWSTITISLGPKCFAKFSMLLKPWRHSRIKLWIKAVFETVLITFVKRLDSTAIPLLKSVYSMSVSVAETEPRQEQHSKCIHFWIIQYVIQKIRARAACIIFPPEAGAEPPNQNKRKGFTLYTIHPQFHHNFLYLQKYRTVFYL